MTPAPVGAWTDEGDVWICNCESRSRPLSRCHALWEDRCPGCNTTRPPWPQDTAGRLSAVLASLVPDLRAFLRSPKERELARRFFRLLAESLR